MQMNKTVKCAIGAMLFGGTLGVSGAADAGLTWDSVYADMYVGSTGVTADSPGATAALGGSSLTQSAATSSGLSISGSNVVGGYQLLVSPLTYVFTVSAPTSIVISGLAPSGGTNVFDSSPYSGVAIDLYGPSSLVWAQNSSGGSYSSGVLNLAAGTYTLQGSLFAAANSGYSGTMLEIAVVPAPGAFALIGVAGLVGGRRRR